VKIPREVIQLDLVLGASGVRARAYEVRGYKVSAVPFGETLRLTVPSRTVLLISLGFLAGLNKRGRAGASR
jgi:hypothetical protein